MNMTTQVTATVLGGMLKPDDALPLADQTRVLLTIQPIGEQHDPRAAWEAIKSRLRDRPVRSLGHRYTRDELHERD
jgi:hypothetical protein